MSAEIIPFPEPLDQRAALTKGIWRETQALMGFPPTATPSANSAKALAQLVELFLAIPGYDVRKSFLPWKDTDKE